MKSEPDVNTGIGDAENLAWKLAMVVNGTAEQQLLDSYEGERRPIAAKAVRSTGAASSLVLGNHVIARLLRERVVVPLRPRRASRLARTCGSRRARPMADRRGPAGPGRLNPSNLATEPTLDRDRLGQDHRRPYRDSRQVR
jgi:4,5-epoxidase